MESKYDDIARIIEVEQAKTLDGLLRERAQVSPKNIAYRDYDESKKEWRSYTWEQMNRAIARWQAALSKEALVSGDRVGVMLKNCPEWVMFEQAALGLGLVVVPFYTEDRAENVAYMLSDATVKLLLLENSDQWQELSVACQNNNDLKRVVIINAADNASSFLSRENQTVLLNDWLPVKGDEVRHVNNDPHSLATIIYTSGTTGHPKGVMLSHHNILTNAYSCLQVIPVTQKDLLLSFLPLSHTFERTSGYYAPMMAGATIAYARSIQHLQEDLLSIRPTILISVPRIYERVDAGIRAKLAEGPKFGKWLFNFAVAVGYSRFEYQQGRASWRLMHLFWPLLKKLVADKVMQKLGGRLRLALSGGAALSAEVSRIFIGLGLPILQGYGMTESSPVVCANRQDNNLPASVGPVIPGVEVKLGENDALLIRGPNVMLGYWNNPDATKSVISSNGWLNSGDIASIDEQGRVTITGRLKEIIVLSTGEKVPPADMEAAIMRDPLFEQVMLIGEGRSFLSVLVILDSDKWEKIALQHKLDPDLYNQKNQQKVEEILLEKISKQTREFPGYARIRRVAWLSESWTVENEMQTPTLKLRRGRILDRYQVEVERLYKGH
jgi:long-chain acyl-CoA synthetase